MKKVYKITSPLNFRSDLNIKHGSFKYFLNIPDWARNNPRIVIETEEVKTDEIKDEKIKVDEKSSNLSTREEQDEKKYFC